MCVVRDGVLYVQKKKKNDHVSVRKTIKVPPALFYDCMVTAGTGIEVCKNSRGATKNYSSMPS